MNRHARRAGKKLVVKLDPVKLVAGPVRHPTLPPMLVERIRRLHSIFKDVFEGDLAKWISDFQRDMHPENEVIIWEGWARAFQTFTGAKGFPPAARKEAFALLMLVGNSSPEELIQAVEYLPDQCVPPFFKMCSRQQLSPQEKKAVGTGKNLAARVAPDMFSTMGERLPSLVKFAQGSRYFTMDHVLHFIRIYIQSVKEVNEETGYQEKRAQAERNYAAMGLHRA